jgi:hypothetical protein
VTESSSRGWSEITVPETTRQAYAVPLEQLAAALADYPKPPSDERAAAGRPQSRPVLPLPAAASRVDVGERGSPRRHPLRVLRRAVHCQELTRLVGDV